MTIQKKTATMKDGSQLYYEITGQGQPLVLLHGNGGSGQYFSEQLPFFSQYFQLVIIDSRGHGQSTNLAQRLNFALMAQDIIQVLDQEHIQQADFIGFSDGANLAMVLAVHYPTRVQRLVLNAGNLDFGGLRKISQWTSYVIVAAAHLLARLNKHFQPLKTASDLLLTDTGLQPADLQTILAPTLVIVGARDVIKLSHSKKLAEQIPNSQFIEVPKVGHNLAQKKAPLFNQLVLDFLTRRLP